MFLFTSFLVGGWLENKAISASMLKLKLSWVVAELGKKRCYVFPLPKTIMITRLITMRSKPNYFDSIISYWVVGNILPFEAPEDSHWVCVGGWVGLRWVAEVACKVIFVGVLTIKIWTNSAMIFQVGKHSCEVWKNKYFIQYSYNCSYWCENKPVHQKLAEIFLLLAVMSSLLSNFDGWGGWGRGHRIGQLCSHDWQV